MKHYAKENWYEADMLDTRMRRCYGYKAKSLAETKRVYARRERAVLKRMTAELVEEEMLGYSDDERRYWWREFERCELDMNDLELAEEYLRESGQWNHDHLRIFAMAYREVRKRSKAAYDEWWEAA